MLLISNEVVQQVLTMEASIEAIEDQGILQRGCYLST